MEIDSLRAALAEVPGTDLQAFALPRDVPDAVTPIFRWLRLAAAWELQRRHGQSSAEFPDPSEEIGLTKMAPALAALGALQEQFEDDLGGEAVARFLTLAQSCIRRQRIAH
jgi:hypothetical protein